MAISYRIPCVIWLYDDAFDELCSLFAKHPTVVDEVAFFADPTHHFYRDIDEMKSEAQILAERIDALHMIGVKSVGINILTTIGHGSEAEPWQAQMPFTAFTGFDGSIDLGTACVNAEGYTEYLAEKYTIYASAHPDFIWVDDDLRMHHHNASADGCACDTCVAKFGAKYGTSFTRESLRKAISDKSDPIWRQRWSENISDLIDGVLALIKRTVHAVDPSIKLGFMTSGMDFNVYNTNDFPRWFKTLGATKARPGGGFYDDSMPAGFFNKMFDMATQNEYYPSFVTDRQYEMENFPYFTLSKSRHILEMESLAAYACGLNGIAYNLISNAPHQHEKNLAMIERASGAWKRICDFSKGFKNVGLYPAYNRFFGVRRSCDDTDWFTENMSPLSETYTFAKMGIPISTNPNGDAPALLTGNLVEGFTKQELTDILARGAYMDGYALVCIEKMGLGHLCGAKAVATDETRVREVFTDDELNGEYAGYIRDSYHMGFSTRYVLESLSKDTRVLADMTSIYGDYIGPCQTAYRNELGGLVVVSGYNPWRYTWSIEKRAQLLNVFEHMTPEGLPVYIEDCLAVVPFARMSADKRNMALTLMSATLDSTEEFDVVLRVKGIPHVYCVADSGDAIEMQAQYTKNGVKVRVPNIAPYDKFIILASEKPL